MSFLGAFRRMLHNLVESLSDTYHAKEIEATTYNPLLDKYLTSVRDLFDWFVSLQSNSVEERDPSSEEEEEEEEEDIKDKEMEDKELEEEVEEWRKKDEENAAVLQKEWEEWHDAMVRRVFARELARLDNKWAAEVFTFALYSKSSLCSAAMLDLYTIRLIQRHVLTSPGL